MVRPCPPTGPERPGAGAGCLGASLRGGRSSPASCFCLSVVPALSSPTLFLPCQYPKPGSQSPRSWPQALTQLLLSRQTDLSSRKHGSVQELTAQTRGIRAPPARTAARRPGPPRRPAAASGLGGPSHTRGERPDEQRTHGGGRGVRSSDRNRSGRRLSLLTSLMDTHRGPGPRSQETSREGMDIRRGPSGHPSPVTFIPFQFKTHNLAPRHLVSAPSRNKTPGSISPGTGSPPGPSAPQDALLATGLAS